MYGLRQQRLFLIHQIMSKVGGGGISWHCSLGSLRDPD